MGNGAPATGNGIDGAKDASANGSKDARPNGSPAARDAASPAAADATIAAGVPAMPADSIGAARGTKPKGPDPDRETPASKAGEQSGVDDSPAYSFGPLPTASARPAAADRARESAVKPFGDDASPTAPSRTAPSSTGPASAGPAGTGPSGAGPSGAGPYGAAPSGRPSSSIPLASAEPPSVSPAAFAWEMPDPPPNSPSSPARTFLRSGTTGKDSVAPTAASSASLGPTSPGQTSPGRTSPSPAKTGAGKAAAAAGPVTMRNAPQKPQKGQSKRNARQAHLTVARVEPWSVMKFSFVVSLVAFVISFVAVIVLYSSLSALGVFESLQTRGDERHLQPGFGA